MWVVMTVILIVVPDWLEYWVPLPVGRALGWAVAGAVWVVSVERQWQARTGPFVRFLAQVALWGSSALVATWISDLYRY